MRKTFYGSKFEAERRIAEIGKAGFLKPAHLKPGASWVLINNPERTITRTQLYHVLVVELERRGTHMHPQLIHRQANEIWCAAHKPTKKRRPTK